MVGPRITEMVWRAAHLTATLRQRSTARRAGEGLMQRTLESRAFLSAVLTIAIGNAVYTLRDFMIDEDFPEAPRPFDDHRQRERTGSTEQHSRQDNNRPGEE